VGEDEQSRAAEERASTIQQLSDRYFEQVVNEHVAEQAAREELRVCLEDVPAMTPGEVRQVLRDAVAAIRHRWIADATRLRAR
jgi:hypothetical protein